MTTEEVSVSQLFKLMKVFGAVVTLDWVVNGTILTLSLSEVIADVSSVSQVFGSTEFVLGMSLLNRCND